MPDTKKRQRAKLVRKFRTTLADQARRQSKRLRDAITAIALRVEQTTEEIYGDADPFIALFNDAAEVIDQHYGGGYFTVRLGYKFPPGKALRQQGLSR